MGQNKGKARRRGYDLAGALVACGLYAGVATAQAPTPTANLTPVAWDNGNGAQIVVNQRATGQSGCVSAPHGTKTVKVVIDGTATVDVVCEPHAADNSPQPVNPTALTASGVVTTDAHCEQLCLNVLTCSSCAVSGYVGYDRTVVR